MARPVGRLLLHGKSEAVEVFEPLAAADEAYEEAFQLLRAGDGGARAAFYRLAAERPGDPLVTLHHARLPRGARDDVIDAR